VPHLRILPDELASAVLEKLGRGAESFGRKAKNRKSKTHRVDLYPKVLIRPICSGCGNPMILGHSDDKYQSLFCFNAGNGIKGCTNRGYKSARIIDEVVLRTVMATLFTDDFITDLTADVNKRLAELARRPNVTSVKEKDIVAALGQLRDLLQSDLGVAAQVLKALVGDVVLEKRQVEGQPQPQMIARFTINAIPAMALLARGQAGKGMIQRAPRIRCDIAVPLGSSRCIGRQA
jgi:hypothetical protein